jgi:hypothetical protein
MWGIVDAEPYSLIVMVFPFVPLPPGCSVPVHVQPMIIKRESPGANTFALTGVSDFHAAAADVPAFVSLPALQST